MTDATASHTPQPGQGGETAKSSLFTVSPRTRRRNASERRFKAYGVTAILLGLLFLCFLVYSILSKGLPAFTRTVAEVELTLTQAQIDEAESTLLKTGAYRDLMIAELGKVLGDVEPDAIQRIVGNPGAMLRNFYTANPDAIGDTVAFELPTASRVDGYFKGRITREGQANSTFLTPADLDLADRMQEEGIIKREFNWQFLTGAEASDDNPVAAGIGVSVVGSLYMMFVVLALSLPIGVAASIYLEEFAPKNRFTDLIEVNISNLAAVPSIVFGILGLAFFIQFAGLPRSAPLVGGLVLTLMTLPTIIISTRASLRAVPPSIRDAALGVGASKMQSVFHHVLPLALPGILTGTIIGLAQALGETAPLLLIGMVGFVALRYPDTIASGFLDSNSAMPAQIYTWAARADQIFYEKAWGGIIVLLVFLLTMNIIAVILRRRFERRW
ncbi:Phosphate transport system permease protein PstA [Pseudooceanicola marinus]|uniref:Phosphate transport system permease protein PstA n=1 Tax=Pseudooceanicola marinus TaxID=396013 RepID=A0A1X6YM34_9RHOB|nr:phosphate ABC transporter permease PstA [Pseudooceanicola marinus]PJE29348.1 phosphate ABC transporter, permease protein PstA [Pseudooceanicola marinus]SLN24778.1 Phosphate transport system permease protein PstA [Pseudooceanicola marinus]